MPGLIGSGENQIQLSDIQSAAAAVDGLLYAITRGNHAAEASARQAELSGEGERARRSVGSRVWSGLRVASSRLTLFERGEDPGDVRRRRADGRGKVARRGADAGHDGSDELLARRHRSHGHEK